MRVEYDFLDFSFRHGWVFERMKSLVGLVVEVDDGSQPLL